MSWALGRIFTQSIKNFLPGKLRTARLIKMNTWLKFFILNPLSANPKKWSNTLKQLVDNLVTNFLSVLDKFVGLALKGLRRSYELYTFNLGDKTVAIRNKIFLQLLKVCYSWLLTHSCCWSFSIPPKNKKIREFNCKCCMIRAFSRHRKHCLLASPRIFL